MSNVIIFILYIILAYLLVVSTYSFVKVLNDNDSDNSFNANRQFGATDFLNPNTADWAINGLAPATTDPTNSAIQVRSFAPGLETGVGWLSIIPTGVSSITFTLNNRGTSTAGTLGFNLRFRKITASVEPWSGSNPGLLSVAIPANTQYQNTITTIALSTLGIIPGNLVQFELTRSATDSLTTVAYMSNLTLSLQ